MRRRIGLLAGLTAFFAVGSAQAEGTCPNFEQANTAINDETGHTFFLYKFGSDVSPAARTWVNAKACLSGLLEMSGVKPHLATITSSSENTWIVDELLRPSLPANYQTTATLTQVWVGGSQASNSATPGDGWRWENSEGPFPGSNGSGAYANWAYRKDGNTVVYSEPNDSPNAGENNQENHLTLGRFPDNLYGWNDEGSNLSSIYGFIVEYDTPRILDGETCIGTSGSTVTCTTVKGQTLTFPPGTFVDVIDPTKDSSFTFTAYEFTDPRVNPTTGRCEVRETLELFKDDAFNLPNTAPGSQSGKLVIPAYLCGSPKFLVVKAVGTNINIPRGVVITENNTTIDLQKPNAPAILPGNLFDCNAPIDRNDLNQSGQTQDVGVWQSLDATEMWENAPESPVARFDGTAAELTTDCGSTLLKTRTKSNFVVGLHIDFGPGIDPQSAAEYNEFIALTQYKIALVRQSVVQARKEGRISSADGRAMIAQLDSARNKLNENDPVSAAQKIRDFLKKVNTSKYSETLQTPFNYNGDHLSRGENILFTLQHKIIPFKP